MAVTTANVADRKGAQFVLKHSTSGLGQEQSALCDNGYMEVRRLAKVCKTILVRVSRCRLPIFKIMPHRVDNAELRGWEKLVNCGRTANASAMRVCNSSICPLGFYSNDGEQGLTLFLLIRRKTMLSKANPAKRMRNLPNDAKITFIMA